VLAKCGLCEECLKLGRGKIGLGRRVGLYLHMHLTPPIE
jgi:hypothetical protein